MSCGSLRPARRLSFAASQVFLAAVVGLVIAGVARAQAPAPPAAGPATAAPAAMAAATTPAPDTAHIEALEKMLSGCTLVGQFTVNGKGDVKPSRERYELSSVKHMQGDMWMITARIKYGEHDVTVPLPLPIRWAGETPVITLDNFTVPGLGSYSARVMFYEDRYMGYWFANKEHGGYLFGAIEHAKDADAGEPKKDAAAPAPAAGK